MKFEKSTVRRYVIFGIVTVLLFGTLVFRLHTLQIVNAGQYQAAATTDRFKTIRLTGKRGMITDAESVVLAMSEDVYNVNFLLTNSQVNETGFKRFTPSILETALALLR